MASYCDGASHLPFKAPPSVSLALLQILDVQHRPVHTANI
jgi:hypothetical protein